MATELKNLQITKVDFVDAGANQRANIVICKKDDTTKGGENVDKTQNDKNPVTKFISAIAKVIGIGEDETKEAIADIAKTAKADDDSEKEPASTAREEGEEIPDTPTETTPKKKDNPDKTNKGVTKHMKINKDLLTDEERAFLDNIEKKAGVPDTESAPDTTQDVNKNAEDVAKNDPAPNKENETEDVFKGLNPAVAELIKSLQAKADAAEERELNEVAKKYEILGKKPEELVPLFKSLKKNPADYNTAIAVLDAAVEASGKAFAEIGKRGVETGGGNDVLSQIEKKAADIRKSDTNISYHESIDKAWQDNPDLLKQYEEAR